MFYLKMIFPTIFPCVILFPTVLSFVPIDELFPFGLKNGDSSLAKSDDNFTRVQLTLRNEFHFFNTSYSSLFVNNNGAISFLEGVSEYTPVCGPLKTPMICPFWTDVNTVLGGSVFFRESKNSSLLLKASKEIQKAYSNFGNLQLGWMFITTWHDVPFFGARLDCDGLSFRNTFQTILTTDGFHSFVMFYYNNITWTTGTASKGNCTGQGGTAAKAGFDFGDSKRFETIPGSCTPEIMNVANTSNFNEAGKWIFRVDESLESTACTSNAKIKKLRIFPSFISMFGHTPILIKGPCLENVTKVECHFHDTIKISDFGTILSDGSAAICQVPFLYTNGRIKIELSVTLADSTENVYFGYIFTKEPHDQQVTFEIDSNSNVNLSWNPASFNDLPEDPQLEVNLFELVGDSWNPRGVLLKKINNTGKYEGTINNFHLRYNLSSTFIVQLRSHLVSIRSTSLRRVKRSDLNPAKQLKTYWKNTGEPKFAFSAMRYSSFRKSENYFDKSCDEWYQSDSGAPNDLLPCPPLLQQAFQDSRFEQDTISGSMLQYYHPGAEYSFRQRNPSPSGGGQQCVYKDGNILLGPPGGGTADLHSPTSFGGVIRHFRTDVVPWMKCCKFSSSESSCEKYFKKRPSDSGHNYIFPQPANGAGDPHITTFDLASYTFNGVGEFWMIKAHYDNFLMQARMEQFIRDDGVSTAASVFTAFAIKERAPFQTEDVHVQISATLSGIQVLLDGETLVLETDDDSGNSSQETKLSVTYNGISVTQFINDRGYSPRVTIASSFGFSFDITASETIALNIVALASYDCRGKTAGLFGVFDGNAGNDLTDPDLVVLPLNSSSQSIHMDFGLKWMTKAEESIFIYPPGKNHFNFQNPNFVPNFVDPDISVIPAEVIDSCAGSRNCLFDYSVTGSLSIAEGSKEVAIQFNETLEVAAIEIKMCNQPPPLQNGFYHAENYFVDSIATFYCNEGYNLVGLTQLTCIKSDVSETHQFHDEFPQCVKAANENNSNSSRKQSYNTDLLLIGAIIIRFRFLKSGVM